MAKQYQPIEVNSFVKGLITEASPLTFPEGASLDERNFVLNKDGTRRRRLGIEEEGGQYPQYTRSEFADKSALTNNFIWTNPGSNPDKNFLVLQDAEWVLIYDRDAPIIGDSMLFQGRPTSYALGQEYSFASVDGALVVATGGDALFKVEYDGNAFTSSVFKLKIRDVFGLDDGLFEGMSVTERPSTEIQNHIYNLRNQTWAVPRRKGNYETSIDPIEYFEDQANLFPSNADTVNQGLFSDPNDSNNRTIRRFFTDEVIDNPLGTVEAPKGYFIIDALDRGNSRRMEMELLYAQYPELKYEVNDYATDKTSTGATSVSEYAGRMWYAGFGNEIGGGDSRSPKLSSYVLFSQVVRDPSNFSACHQAADPTNPDDSSLVDTDGGFIRVEEAVNIRKLVNLGRRLIVLADNGIWSIEGGSDYGFTASNYLLHKISDKGALSNSSVVVVDQSMFYWSESGLMYLNTTDLGDFVAENMTNTTIQTLYNGISYEDKVRASGSYDSYEEKVHWVYGGNKELILDLNLQAFYLNEFSDSTKEVRSIFNVSAYREGVVTENITVNDVSVTVNGQSVEVSNTTRQSGIREVKYIVVSDINAKNGELTFATMRNTQFKDWGTTDAPAYLITGYTTGGDFQRNKNVPYLTLHFERTESGFDANYVPVGQSSCLTRVAWEWSNSPKSNRWGREFQGYRFKRVYMAASPDDEFDTGFAVVTTKNKLRGRGKSLSLQFRTEPEKDCHLLGWSMVMGINNNV